MTQQYFHSALNAHKGIGIDIDQTLINGPASLFLQNWVQTYHCEIDLHLVTFRTGRWLDQLPDDVFQFGIQPHMFKGIHSVPVETAGPFWDLVQLVGDKRAPNLNQAKWLRSLAYHGSSEELYDSMEATLALWKGTKCKELGLTALIDDLEHWVVPGCTLHGVTWIDALTLQPEGLGRVA